LLNCLLLFIAVKMLDIYEYYQKMHSKNIILAYKGNVSGDVFNCILQLAENKLEKIELRAKVKKKVFNILVEILQNIYHHFDDSNQVKEDYFSVLFLLSKVGSDYKIITGNHIELSKVDALKEKIDAINSMSEEELKTVYREQLNHGGVSDKGGAGLGILDIVRKSGEKVKYEFKEVNSDYSFFSMQVKVSA
jgi:hypothetical protein